jgi:hypothetical protein
MKANADSADPCTLLPWDTQFWGFPVARLAAATLTTATAEEAVAWWPWVAGAAALVAGGVTLAFASHDAGTPETVRIEWP